MDSRIASPQSKRNQKMSCDAMSYCFSGSVLRARTHAELIARDQASPCMTAIEFTHSLNFEK
jgi:hypothetical protein